MRAYRAAVLPFALLLLAAQAQAQRVLYTFGLKDGDPLYPKGITQLVEGPDGSMYGTTAAATVKPAKGTSPRKDVLGSIFKITPDGKLDVLYRFDGSLGASPQGGLTIGTDGTLYGTASGGGKYAGGTVFRLGPGEAVPTVLWDFMHGWYNQREPLPPPDEMRNRAPAYPISPPVLDSAGNLYGVSDAWRGGMLYTIPKGGKFKALCRFNADECKTGSNPNFLLMGKDGNLYGTTNSGPAEHRYGAVFKATTAGAVETLHWFDVAAEGASPDFLMQGSDGALYGTAPGGGPRGVVFRLTLNKDYKVLRYFSGGDGMYPDSLVQRDDGYLYGTTGDGGSAAWVHGVVFRMKPDGSDFCVLHEFDGSIGSFGLGLVNHRKGGLRGPEDSLFGIALGLAGASGGVFFQMPISKPLELSGPPGSRTCCTFDHAAGIDASNLGNHIYGNISRFSFFGPVAAMGVEHTGYVYTANGGLVDLGHVRDNADVTFYVFEQLANGNQSPYTPVDFVSVISALKLPCDKDKMLQLAGAIAYLGGWAHELVTWGSLPLPYEEDFSAFSPEDLPSNIVGVEVATRAIRAGGDASVEEFNRQVDVQLAGVLTELNAQAATATDKMLHDVEFTPGQNLQGKWWMKDLNEAGITLLRRNFDGFPWLLPRDGVTGSAPPWLNPHTFDGAYQQLLFKVRARTDATRVPLSSLHAMAGNGSPLQWTLIPAQSLPVGGAWEPRPDGVTGYNILSGTQFGQFGLVLVNQAKGGDVRCLPPPAQPAGASPPPSRAPAQVACLATLRAATAAIRNWFVYWNPGMDGPLNYFPPRPQPAK